MHQQFLKKPSANKYTCYAVLFVVEFADLEDELISRLYFKAFLQIRLLFHRMGNTIYNVLMN